MEKTIIKTSGFYADPAQEAYLQQKKEHLLATIELQGRQDGSQNRPKTLDEYRAMALLYIEATIQSCINIIQQKYLPISGMGRAKIIEQDAVKKETEVQIALNEDERKLQVAEGEAKRLKPDVKLIIIRRWVMAGLIFIAAFEGWASYMPFRYSNFPILLALAASIGVAVAVGLASHHLGGGIRKATTTAQAVVRYLVALVPGIIGFGYLGVLRANAFNHTSRLAVGTHEVMNEPRCASAVAIAVISILLYWIGLFISAKFYRTQAERVQEEAYETKCVEVADLKASIAQKQAEINDIRQDKAQQIALAFATYEYALAQERGLISFAYEVAEIYKQRNLRHRTDGQCPDCFSHKPTFNFTTFFQNAKPQEHETA